MKLWLITSIDVADSAAAEHARPLPASTLQNLRTAAALATAGHRVLLWVAGAPADPAAFFARQFGEPMPAGLLWLPYRKRGPRDEKATPFETLPQALTHLWQARRRGMGGPHAIITRSPRVLERLACTWGIPPAARRILEWQYPEHMQLWRAHKGGFASPGAARQWLRAKRDAEFLRLHHADGVLYAAADHARLLHLAGYTRPARLLPSGCAAPLALPSPTAAEFELGYVGGLAPENGLPTLLAALALLPPTVRLLIVGGSRGEQRAALEREAERLGLAARIHWAGWVAPGDVGVQMQRCRLGVVPLSRRLGPEKRQFASPLKLIEWWRAGVPVVASTVPSVATRVQAQAPPPARLFTPDDPQSLSTAIGALLADPPLAAQLAAAGQACAAGSTFAHRAAAIVDFVRDLHGKQPQQNARR